MKRWIHSVSTPILGENRMSFDEFDLTSLPQNKVVHLTDTLGGGKIKFYTVPTDLLKNESVKRRKDYIIHGVCNNNTWICYSNPSNSVENCILSGCKAQGRVRFQDLENPDKDNPYATLAANGIDYIVFLVDDNIIEKIAELNI